MTPRHFVAGIVVILVVMMGTLITEAVFTCRSACTFTTADWQRAPHDRSWRNYFATSRLDYVEDLLDRRLLVGKSPSEVQATLGAPERENGVYGWEYRLAGWPLDPGDRLIVEFDRPTNMVSHAWREPE